MPISEEDNKSYERNGKECVNVEMYETGEGGFHVFNLAPNHYHRQEALERTGAVEITGYLDKVIHGTISPTEYGSIIVMQWYFQPGRGRRISEATINLLFEPESSDSDTELEVRDISFEGTYGLMTTSQPQGIPGMLRVAVLVARDDEEKFQCRVNFACKTDLKTKLAGMFQRIPKDDPIIFQPDSSDKGRRENKAVTYGIKDLGNMSLDDLSDVTYKRVISNGEKAWK
ncbi:unnamed protein product [Fusarium langsethiae]|nr:unnamed protein product [Fusarium langsethiae]